MIRHPLRTLLPLLNRNLRLTLNPLPRRLLNLSPLLSPSRSQTLALRSLNPFPSLNRNRPYRRTYRRLLKRTRRLLKRLLRLRMFWMFLLALTAWTLRRMT